MDIASLTQQIERVSQKYASDYGIERNDQWFILKLQEELGELIQIFLMRSGQARRKDKTEVELKDMFDQEVADVFCHILLLAHHAQVPLERVVEQKWLTWLSSEQPV